MSREPATRTLLALDAGVRRTGWALFRNSTLRDTGVISISRHQGITASHRVSYLVQCLDGLLARWQPDQVACCQPAGIRWPAPSLELLEVALSDWRQRRGLFLCSYTRREVRASIAGRPNASQDQLGYAIMELYRLIGRDKSTDELEAIAVGHHHMLYSRNEEG